MVSPQESTNEYLLLGGLKRTKSKSIVIGRLINIITRRTTSRIVRKYRKNSRKEMISRMEKMIRRSKLKDKRY